MRALLALLMMMATAQAEPIDPWKIGVVDGDTIHVDGRSENTRLVGFNTPEITDWKCPQERALGFIAKGRLIQIVIGGELDLTFVRCACADGTHGTKACNGGRSCARLTAKGQDVGAILVREKLAAPLICGRTKCEKLPRPWCY